MGNDFKPGGRLLKYWCKDWTSTLNKRAHWIKHKTRKKLKRKRKKKKKIMRYLEKS